MPLLEIVGQEKRLVFDGKILFYKLLACMYY